MFHGHILVVEAEGDQDAFSDLIHLIETQAPYMLDNVIVKSVINRDNSAESMGETVRLILPNASFSDVYGEDEVIHTGMKIITSEDNPSIPEGESEIVASE